MSKTFFPEIDTNYEDNINKYFKEMNSLHNSISNIISMRRFHAEEYRKFK